MLLFPDREERSDPYFRLTSLDPIAGWLRLHFEVEEVQQGEDPIAAVDRVRPDLGLMIANGGRLAFDRSQASRFRAAFGAQRVPLGVYSVMDAHAPGKMGFFGAVASLGVDAIFSPDTGLKELAGEFADRVFYVPWFVDEKMFRDYGLEKRIPIALMGAGFERDANATGYPWRASVASALRDRFPVFSSPRPSRRQPHDLIGEAYSRTLNRSRLAFTCGSVREILVKKHFEIPASGSCLVTQDTPAVRDIGFVNGENCVFATPENVVEVCAALLEDDDRLEAISRRGLDFVHTFHVASARNTLVQWLRCWQVRSDGQAIVQSSLSASLELEALAESQVNERPRPLFLGESSPVIQAMRKGMKALFVERNARKALDCFETMTRFNATSPEARIYRSAALLALGHPSHALKSLDETLWQGILRTLHRPDPVVWGLNLVTLAAGDAGPELRLRCARAFPSLRHPLLDWARAKLGADRSRERNREWVENDGMLHQTFLALPADWSRDDWESFGDYLLTAGSGPQSVKVIVEPRPESNR